MPPRQWQRTAEELRRRETHKHRQEKFRKRSRSKWKKIREMAEDTDAFVSLAIGFKDGRVDSYTAADDRSWLGLYDSFVTACPWGRHQFLQKSLVSGFWVPAGDQIKIASPRANLGEAESPANNTIVVDNNMEEQQADHQHALWDTEVGHDDLAEMDPQSAAVLLAVPDTSLPDKKLNEATAHVEEIAVDPSTRDNSTVDSSKEQCAAVLDLDMPIFDFGFDVVNDDAIGESYQPSKTNTISAPNISGEPVGTAPLGTADSGQIASGSDTSIEHIGIAIAETAAQPLEVTKDATEAANALQLLAQHQHPENYAGDWQVVNQPMVPRHNDRRINPKELLHGWNWVFQKQESST